MCDGNFYWILLLICCLYTGIFLSQPYSLLLFTNDSWFTFCYLFGGRHVLVPVFVVKDQVCSIGVDVCVACWWLRRVLCAQLWEARAVPRQLHSWTVLQCCEGTVQTADALINQGQSLASYHGASFFWPSSFALQHAVCTVNTKWTLPLNSVYAEDLCI